MVILIILCMCLITLRDLFLTKASIVWELETIPAVFEKDVVLKCTLPQNCCKIKQSRRWLGGNDLHLLKMNGFSIDTAKYSEKFNEENKTSTLTIHTFDIEDINIPYECIYGSSTFVQILNWTEDIFESTIIWELEPIPAVFGKDVILKCTLPQNCCKKMQSRRWLGGNDLHLLSMNGFSVDTDKYSEDFNKEYKTSILTIHDFDVMDINVPYECIYGSSTFVKILNLTEDAFEYQTSGPYLETITITETNVLSVNISTGRVYPRPNCSSSMNDEDITSKMITITILKGLFFFATISVTLLLTPASCPGLLVITCDIGTYLSVYEKNVTCDKIFTDKTQATIVWELDTIPSVFGKDVILKCTFPQYCCKKAQSRRWLGGNDLHLLTINGFSIDSDKYSEVLNKENKFSLLTIHSFNIKDINVPYECSYGLSTFVKILNLTEDKFEYHPSGQYIGNISLNETNLYVNVSTEKVFPRPKCSAAMNDDDISSYMTTTVIMKGLFYFAIITLALLLTPESCPGFLSITCEIGTYLFVYEKNITCNMIESNTDKEVTNMRALVLIIIATASLLVLIATYVVYKIRGSHGNTHLFNEEERAMNLDTLPKRRNEKRVKMK